MEPVSPAVGRQALYHCATKEVLHVDLFSCATSSTLVWPLLFLPDDERVSSGAGHRQLLSLANLPSSNCLGNVSIHCIFFFQPL